VEAHNLVEEGTRHRGRRVGVAEGDEVRIFGEPVDDGEDDRLAADARESFHEVECDILPYRCGHRKRLEETGGMQMFCLVALAGGAAVNVVAHQTVGAGVVERGAQPVQGLLNTLMSRTMGRGEDARPEGGGRRHKDSPSVHDEAIGHAPGSTRVAAFDFRPLGDELWQGRRLTSEVLEELDIRAGDGTGGREHHRLVTTREMVP